MIDDASGEGSPDVQVDNASDGPIDVSIVCTDEGGADAAGFSVQPSTVDPDSTAQVTVVAGAAVSDGTYTCVITVSDGEQSVETTVEVVVNRDEDGPSDVDGLGLPDDGSITFTIDDSDQGSADFSVTRVDGFGGNVTLVGECSRAACRSRA